MDRKGQDLTRKDRKGKGWEGQKREEKEREGKGLDRKGKKGKKREGKRGEEKGREEKGREGMGWIGWEKGGETVECKKGEWSGVVERRGRKEAEKREKSEERTRRETKEEKDWGRDKGTGQEQREEDKRKDDKKKQNKRKKDRNEGEKKRETSFKTFYFIFGSFLGQYIYFETSSPAVWADKASLSSPDLGVRRGCLSFWYHMFGGRMGSLRVLRLNAAGRKILWSRSKNQGDQWLQAHVEIQEDSLYNVCD